MTILAEHLPEIVDAVAAIRGALPRIVDANILFALDAANKWAADPTGNNLGLVYDAARRAGCATDNAPSQRETDLYQAAYLIADICAFVGGTEYSRRNCRAGHTTVVVETALELIARIGSSSARAPYRDYDEGVMGSYEGWVFDLVCEQRRSPEGVRFRWPLR